MKKIITYFLLHVVFILPIVSQVLIQPTHVDSVLMRDGKKLAVDVYIPDTTGGAAYPVILVQTPYNRLKYRTVGLPLFGNNMATANYGMVIADWRCFYGSSAACAGNYDRANDGYDLVEWIAAQSWCNGKVGTWGPSALGGIQFKTARKRPPHLVCAVPLVAGPQYSYSEYYPGGVYRTEYVQQLDALGFGLSATLLAHQVYDMAWNYAETINYYPDSINVPLLMIGGWYDHNINAMMEFYAGIRQSSFITVRDKHRLLMGPWTHGGHGNAGVGAPQQGELSYPNAAGWSDSLALAHFDYYMRSVPNNWNTSPYIQYYQMGENEWKDCPVWPPSGVTEHTLYFQANGGITTSLPSAADVYKEFLYDPNDPSPTIGGSTLNASLVQGPYDQAPLVESRSDMLVFTTDVLTADVVMKGKAKIHLFVSSDRKDTDFSVRLTDVYPDNRSMLLSDGIARMRFRDGFTANDTSCMTPGQVYEILIELPDIAVTFLAGHRIRVDVSSSDYPRFDCNLNNGGAMYVAGDTLVASNKVFVGSNHASYIQMPLNGFYTGLPETSLSLKPQIEIFPNPASDFITVNFSDFPDKDTTITITDIGGKSVFTEKCNVENFSERSIRIALEGMTNGLYNLKINSSNYSFTEKFIIQK